MTQSTKRQLCSICVRPLKTCICSFCQRVDNQIGVTILQHPLEMSETKNTGRLLHLCLNNSVIAEGESFDEITLNSLTAPNTLNILLYPPTNEEKSLGILPPPTVDLPKIMDEKTNLRLWVLDATWRKSRKMLYLNPFLQKMPRIHLENTPSSLYTIRKAHYENQLSTLEATCYALQQLEQNRVDYTPVLAAMQAFVNNQRTFIPNRP